MFCCVIGKMKELLMTRHISKEIIKFQLHVHGSAMISIISINTYTFHFVNNYTGPATAANMKCSGNEKWDIEKESDLEAD